ncbi:NAD(P)/FAD-dependent oxidoreductase [Salinigranum sp.]|uniref:NAD(P)/FAD-dependent oxidoreductase n=1 Tax=Salinigranum sp. TaxID=1966351 RepID=UPI00356ABFB3
MTHTDTMERRYSTHDHDVVIVGGGPAGCSAGVFTARAGLDTVIFDRGRSSISRCAHLENYLGFPGGIDIETMYELMHDHARTAGCAFVPDLVESVGRRDDGVGFVVQPQEGEPVTARRVVAATRYDGEYLRGLDEDAAMFETDEHDGEEREPFDGTDADHDGVTPVEGLYVASPSDEADLQAIVAAGRGGRVARRVVADARIDAGWWEAAATRPDWVRRRAELDDEWADRETWVEWFDEYLGEDAPVDPSSERYRRVREAAIDDARDSYVAPAEIERRSGEGRRTLAGHLGAEAVVEAFDDETLLEAMDDDVIRAYVAAEHQSPEASD